MLMIFIHVCQSYSHAPDAMLTPSISSSNKNTPISQLPRLHLFKRLRKALLTELKLLNGGSDVVVRRESKHIVMGAARSDQA